MKLSFLIAAHNEEKIIGKTLKNLLNLPYSDYEVILGLDGCTDETEEIVKSFVKKSKKFKYYKLNLRSGKPAVVNQIMKKAKGDIIVINDADWIFRVKDRNSLERFLSVFDDPSVGGIAESFPVEWEKESLDKANWVFKMVAYSSMGWLDFQKQKMARGDSEKKIITEPTMFLTNIFRKELHSDNFSLGDDFERTKYITDKGYKVAVFDNPEIPRMIVVYNKIKFKDFFNQKIRTAMARRQLKGRGLNNNYAKYYSNSLPFILVASFRRGVSKGLLISVWIILSGLGDAVARFKPQNTKKGWTMRLRR